MGRLFTVLPMAVVSAAVAPNCLAKHKGAPDAESPGFSRGALECAGLGVPATVHLTSTAALDLAALSAAREGAIFVRAERRGCGLALSMVEGCTAPIDYERRQRVESHIFPVREPAGFLSVLALSAERLRADFESGTSYRLGVKVSSKLRLDPERGVRRSALGPDCAAATHLVAAVDLGHFALFRGTDERIAEGNLKGLEVVAHAGNALACTDTKSIRPKDCSTPVRLDLWPIAADEGPPEGMIALEGFSLDRFEVSAAAYRRCVAAGACASAGTGRFCTGDAIGKERHPINCLAWADAAAYCKFAGKRLPTAAEWMKAAAAKYPWGDAWPPPPEVANLADASARELNPDWVTIADYDDGFAGPAPVDAHLREGFVQLGGNVSEWVEDRHMGGHVLKGGSFGVAHGTRLESAHFEYYVDGTRSMHFGVRCAK